MSYPPPSQARLSGQGRPYPQTQSQYSQPAQSNYNGYAQSQQQYQYNANNQYSNSNQYSGASSNYQPVNNYNAQSNYRQTNNYSLSSQEPSSTNYYSSSQQPYGGYTQPSNEYNNYYTPQPQTVPPYSHQYDGHYPSAAQDPYSLPGHEAQAYPPAHDPQAHYDTPGGPEFYDDGTAAAGGGAMAAEADGAAGPPPSKFAAFKGKMSTAFNSAKTKTSNAMKRASASVSATKERWSAKIEETRNQISLTVFREERNFWAIAAYCGYIAATIIMIAATSGAWYSGSAGQIYVENVPVLFSSSWSMSLWSITVAKDNITYDSKLGHGVNMTLKAARALSVLSIITCCLVAGIGVVCLLAKFFGNTRYMFSLDVARTQRLVVLQCINLWVASVLGFAATIVGSVYFNKISLDTGATASFAWGFVLFLLSWIPLIGLPFLILWTMGKLHILCCKPL